MCSLSNIDQDFVRDFCRDKTFRTEVVRQFIGQLSESLEWSDAIRDFVQEYHRRTILLKSEKTDLSQPALHYQISRW